MAFEQIESYIELDLYDYASTPAMINAIALDNNARSVTALICERGRPYNIGQNANVVLTIMRPDKTGAQLAGQTHIITGKSSIGPNTTIYGVYAELTQSALSEKGSVKAQFKITSGNQVLRTEIFTISTGQALDADITEWTDYQGYNLDELIQSVTDLSSDVTEIQGDVSELKEGLTQKVSIEQGTAHAGEALIIGADGNVTTGEAGVSVDPTLTIEGKAADAKATGDAISAVGKTVSGYDDRIQGLKSQLEIQTPITTFKNKINNAYMDTETGLYHSDGNYSTVYYAVVEGWELKVESKFRCQFQNANTAPSSGTSPRLGDTYEDGTFYLTVPNGATYLAMAFLKTDSVPTISIVRQRLDTLEERLLSDEDVMLLLEQAQDNIREINLNADFFKNGYSSRRTTLKVFNPTTLKGQFPSTPSAELYDNVDIGARTLYLVAGDKIITNIDAIYDNSILKLTNLVFANSGYYGVILSTFANNGDVDNGSVYFGREVFDGKWRVLDIEVTGYYELSFRQNVNYTNKAYILHQHKRIVDKADIIADITDSLQFHDGYLAYNAVKGWDDLSVDNVGTAGKYTTKNVMLPDLSSYVGKSVLITGYYTSESRRNVPSVVYYSNGEPTTHHFSYVYDSWNKDYCAFPILEGYDLRIQFLSTTCLPFVRVLVVDNETLFKNGLANPVFYGKKILGFGDSYIAGQGISFTWHYTLALENICEYVNKGYGGAGLCFGANGSLLNHISDLDEDADIYILCFGRNDNSTNIKIGENDDELDTSVEWTSGYLINTATFKGAMNYLFNLIETKHPYAKIILVTPWGFENNAGVTSGLSCLDYIEAMRLMATKWGITFFNAAGDAGIHVRIEAFRTQYFLASNDQSHLNNDGHALMCKRATKLLTNLLYDD